MNKESNTRLNDIERYMESLAKSHINTVLTELRREGLLGTESIQKTKTKTDENVNDSANQEGKEPDLSTESTAVAVQHIYDLRDLIRAVYGGINNVPSPQLNSMKGYSLAENLHDVGILDIPNLTSSVIQTVMDDHTLLRDEEIQKETIEKLDIKQTFFPVVNKLLEHLVAEKVKEEFTEYDTKLSDKQSENPDIVSLPPTKTEAHLLFEVFYREKSVDVIRQDISSAIERLVRYDRNNNTEANLVVVNFSNEGSDVLNKIELRFKQQLEELYPAFMNRVFLIALYAKNLHFLKEELIKLKVKIQDTDSNISETSLMSQPVTKEDERLDDHIYHKVFNLAKYSYEVTVQPLDQVMPHWRMGLVFSENEVFNSRANRHAPDYRMVHITKNRENEGILVTTYGPKAEIESEVPSRIKKYSGEPLTFIVYYDGNQTTVEIVTSDRIPILDKPKRFKGYPMFKMLAWADKHNHFSFRINIKEKKLRLPKATSIQDSKSHPSFFTVRIGTENNTPVDNVHVLALLENNTFHELHTDSSGYARFKLPDVKEVTVLAAHPRYLCAVIDKVSTTEDILITLKESPGAGSLIIPLGEGHIPDLDGKINPILDPTFRKYMYADNIDIDGKKQQPVYFELNEPILLVDKKQMSRKALFRLIRGRTSILDYIA